MPTPTQHPEREICAEVAGRITSAAIRSGKLDTDVETVKRYITEIYSYVLKLITAK